MTCLYLAWSGAMAAQETLVRCSPPQPLLVSWPYLGIYRRRERELPSGRRMLDSGAFTAWRSGRAVDIEALTREGVEGGWDEVVALDDIADHRRSLENARWMRARGSPAFPVFHYGEPWGLLADYCGEFEKVGLSCRFGEPVTDSVRWVEQCFARHWPKRFHSFGWVAPRILLRVPFHSADTATWAQAPGAWGRWASFGFEMLSLNSSQTRRATLLSEVDYYRGLEARAEGQWRAELAKL